MGIAACQARFLGITARKSNCEFRSTEIAQQKAQLSERLSDISVEYSDAINATKLIWENPHNDMAYGLTYNICMQPSAANDYNPYLITSTTGAIILSGHYAEAAEAAGISMAGGKGDRNKFLEALHADKIITDNTYNQIINVEKIPYNDKTGVGAEPLNKEGIEVCDIGTLANSDTCKNAKIFDEEVMNKLNTSKTDATQSESYSIIKNAGTKTDQSSLQDMSLRDLLLDDVVAFVGKQNQSKELFKDIIEPTLNKIALALGYNYDCNHDILEGTGLWVDDESYKALQIAYKMTLSKYKHSASQPYGRNSRDLAISNAQELPAGPERDKALAEAEAMKNRGDTSNAHGSTFGQKGSNAAYDYANTYMGVAQNANGQHSAVNLSNMLNVFLTYYAKAISGDINSEYTIGKSVETSNFVTDDLEYKYIINDSDKKYTQAEKIADFYDEMFNNIQLHGWRRDDSLLDEQYLEAKLKDGRYSMSALNDDGWYYQTRYNDTGYMKEVQDDDAIARAEADFTQKKAEITAIEDRLDIKMKQLDAEIAELNTECEAVKNLISQAVQKTFQMFQN